MKNDRPQVNVTDERSGWPSLPRPDLKTPPGWSLGLVHSVNRIYNHSLSPDGKTIAFLWDRDGFTEVYCMPAAGGWPQRVSVGRPAYQYWWEETPRWSPDSQYLAFTVDGVVQAAARGALAKAVSDFTPRAGSPMWMPDSFGLLMSVERDEKTQIVLGDRQGGWPRLAASGEGDYLDVRPSPDGKWAAAVFAPLADLNRWEVRLIGLGGEPEQRIEGLPGTRDASPRWSPDGGRIAFLSNRSGFYEVWTADGAGGPAAQLTQVGKDLSDLAWSPDGRWLAVTVNDNGAFHLGLVDAADGELHLLRERLGCHLHPQWGPKGDFLTFEYTDPLTPPDIYRMTLRAGADGRLEAGTVRALTVSLPEAMEGLKRVMPEAVSYPSFDGLRIPALLFRPEKPNGAAILHPHGGPRDQYVYDWDPLVQYWVAKGYTYLSINYRGGSGYGREFELMNQDSWGIGDTQDCLYGARYLSGLAGVDAERIGIMGGSYGGYMTICSLSRDPEHRFACGVCLYGDADIFSSWALCERGTRLYTEMQLGHPALTREVYRAGSPILQVNQVQKPVLILHGLEDEVVPPQASQEWVEALRAAGKTFEYKTYAGESHGFLKWEVLMDVGQRIERFLDWWLMPKP